MENQITVCVRKRPLNEKEKKSREVDVVTVPGKDKLVLHEPKNKVSTFSAVVKQVRKIPTHELAKTMTAISATVNYGNGKVVKDESPCHDSSTTEQLFTYNNRLALTCPGGVI